MGRSTIRVVLAIVLMTATWCAPIPLGAKTIDGIVAVVGDEVITQSELDRRLKVQQVSGKKAVDDKARRRAVIESLINDRLMSQILKTANIEVTEDDLARAIGNVLHQTGMTIEQLRAEVASKGMTYDEYKKEVEKQIQQIKFINQVIGPQVKITEQDIRDYYQRHQENYRGSSRAHIAQIFLSFAGIQSQDQADALRDTAISISTQARKGKNFKELAKKYSQGPNSETGGDLGMIDLKDVPQAVADTVRNMKVGDVSTPIYTDNGLMIVKVIALPELSPDDFGAARDRIYQALYEEKIEETLAAYLQKERQKAFIEIR
jgi:peptidyl-prolyl cis-trans isomerase SurA